MVSHTTDDRALLSSRDPKSNILLCVWDIVRRGCLYAIHQPNTTRKSLFCKCLCSRLSNHLIWPQRACFKATKHGLVKLMRVSLLTPHVRIMWFSPCPIPIMAQSIQRNNKLKDDKSKGAVSRWKRPDGPQRKRGDQKMFVYPFWSIDKTMN